MNQAVLSNVSIHNVFLYCARDTGEALVWLWGSPCVAKRQKRTPRANKQNYFKIFGSKNGLRQHIGKALPQVEIIPKQTL